MHFIQAGLSALLALTSVVGVLAAPVGDVDSNVYERDGPDFFNSLETRNVPAASTPPTEADFTAFFSSAAVKAHSEKLVFWSGVTEADSTAFAQKHGRTTLEMLLKSKPEWEPYMAYKSKGGYWPDWPAASANFWRPLSKAFATMARGEVWYYATEERIEAQKKTTTETAWVQAEKPILLASLASKKVTKISAYKSPDGALVGPITSTTT
ncbi:hypothetical protein OIDMADRAFT_26165 [Oidiodendron maius Zn]|uniref:Uncharacterized protein n=1 Tax=Oidiodendron maius (strain Zn) TaxID=913774 RepID=A0A0C3HMA1_OIDMZ|nr:hypothetical protein OIDMADRAFT_26165 [Oidiodendron maius Zn]